MFTQEMENDSFPEVRPLIQDLKISDFSVESSNGIQVENTCRPTFPPPRESRNLVSLSENNYLPEGIKELSNVAMFKGWDQFNESIKSRRITVVYFTWTFGCENNGPESKVGDNRLPVKLFKYLKDLNDEHSMVMVIIVDCSVYPYFSFVRNQIRNLPVIDLWKKGKLLYRAFDLKDH
ncbi:hypothetical protein ACOME3_008014 [Neoechinorhynchus agilis]